MPPIVSTNNENYGYNKKCDEDADLLNLVDEIINESKSFTCQTPLVNRKPKSSQLPKMERMSSIDRHNMSLPSVLVDKNAKPRIFDTTNKIVGKPFSIEKEIEAIKDAQRVVPCSFCLATKQGSGQAYRHTYSDKNGKVSCLLVVDFINRIHEQQGISKDCSKAKTSKADIELLLRKTLESSTSIKTLRSTWPSCSVSSGLNSVVPNNLNYLLNKLSTTGQSAQEIYQNKTNKLSKISPRLNYFNYSDEKTEELIQTDKPFPRLLNQSFNLKYNCCDLKPSVAFNQQNKPIFSNSANSTALTYVLKFLNCTSSNLKSSKSMDCGSIKEKWPNCPDLKALQSVTVKSGNSVPLDIINSNYITRVMNDSVNSMSISGCNSKHTSNTFVVPWPKSLPTPEKSRQLSVSDDSSDDSGVNDFGNLEDLFQINEFIPSGVSTF